MYAEKKATMSDREREALRERNKKRAQAEKRKQALRNEEEANEMAFKSPQSFGRAVRRVKKSLPGEKQKQVQVLSNIIDTMSPTKRRAVLETCDSVVKRRKDVERKTRSDALTEDQIAAVQQFYSRDDISRMCPGKKDCISVKTPQGKESRQKRLMLLNINEIYELFKRESDLSIGKSKLLHFDLRK